MPFFTTVIPSYNRRTLIAATIDSVLSQEFRDNEVIVVDDGSTDGTLDVLDAYRGRIRVIEQPNSGPGPARNLGARHAAGEYIAFLDSDDLWLPWTLATYKAVITLHPTASVIAARHQDIAHDADLRTFEKQSPHTSYYPTFFDSPRGWTIPSAMILRAGVLEAAGGYTGDIRIGEDADFWLRLGSAPGFVQVDAPATVGYRVHAGGISQNWAGRAAGVTYLINAEKQGRYPGGARYQTARRDYICRHARPISLDCLRHGLQGEATDIYAATMAWNARLARIRYLAAFPALAAYRAVRR